ncbi:MAG: TrkH family potassium uptake protein [Halobacteriota archaeon]
MNIRLVLNFLGKILIYFTGILIIPLIIALYYGESYIPFIAPMAISVFLGGIFILLKPESEVFRYKEGLAIVGLGWFLVSFIGSFVFMSIGVHPVDALFESMSGFTTTGATIFDSIESLPMSVLFWRNFTQWLGGMGIIVLFVAIFPAMASRSETLFHAEYPGVTLEKLKPRLEDTALILYSIYLFFTLLIIGILYLLGVPIFDSVIHAFTTISTGGFSNHTESIAFFNNWLVEGVITFFMLVGGINFALHYYLLKERKPIYRDPEFKVYLMILASASVIIILLNLNSLGYMDSVRYSVFQVVSISTSTGYTTADFDTWGMGAKMILLVLMFIGGSSGSTSGGMKVTRIYILVKYAFLQVLKVAEPRTARTVKYGDNVVKKDILNQTAGFFILYILVFAVSAILISMSNYDFLTTVSSVTACISNIGPAMGLAGASESYAFFPYHIKMILLLNMWIGRLEIFTVLALFMPQFWMRKW